MKRLPVSVFAACLSALLLNPSDIHGQVQNELEHRRGRLWETVANDGFIGSLAAWDYLSYKPFGLFPGFVGFVHPVGNEFLAVNAYSNANMHQFRGGCWIVAKDFLSAGTPPTYFPTVLDYELYASGLQTDAYGVEQVLIPLEIRNNYIEGQNFNPLLPEEMITATWNTNIGITVTRRSYTWSFPGYRDFIIYDYIFKNTGFVVSTITSTILPDTVLQKINRTLTNIYFVFHSGVSVSTKSQINFHTTLDAVQAGAFGWNEGAYHDYYRVFDDGALVFSHNYNGGKRPPWFDPYPVKDSSEWRDRFGPELQSPAAFGWLALYASPTGGTPRATAKPDVLRIDSHKGGTFAGRGLDLERFIPRARPNKDFFDFATTPDSQVVLGNSGKRMNFYTFTYGPYTLAKGDSVRIIIAEIAGVMDMNEVNAGDPNNHYPDSTVAAIRRNAANARNAVKWGMGHAVDGMPLAADVPEPPPPPTCDAVNASVGSDTALVAVVWEKNAETATIVDGSGAVFYNGATDLDGYRIYKSTDFQFGRDNDLPVFRGEAWTLMKDIPISEASQYFDPKFAKYRLLDTSVVFGFRYGYYVSAYRNANPSKTWTSANGTTLTGIPELESGSINKTPATSAAPGPVSSMDVFVAPNPYVYGDPDRSFGAGNPTVEFRNLPESCTIRIYTITGDLVKTLEHKPDARGNVYGSEVWDQKTESGLVVAPGLYIYHVKSNTPGVEGSLTGKLMIIR